MTLTSGGGTLDDNTVSINDVEEALLNQVSVFPNPSSTGMIQLKYNFKESIDLKLEVVDVTGRKVFDNQYNSLKSGSQQIDLSKLSGGVYVVKLITGGISIGKKIIINK